MCANPRFLNGTLRTEWGYTGHVVSDCGAVGNILFPQKKAASISDAAARAMNAGTDMNCGR